MATQTSQTVTYDTLGALTDKHFLPVLVDNVFMSSPGLAMLRENEDVVDGGTQIVQPVSYTTTPNAGRWAGDMGVIPTSYVEHATAALFDDRHYYASITLSKTKVAKNSGKRQIVNLVKAQVELAQATLRKQLGTDFYLSGAVDANGNRGLDGLNFIITYGSDAITGGYGSITRVGASGAHTAPVGNGYWNACPLTAGGGTVTRWKGTIDAQSATTLSLILMQNAYGAVSMNGEYPNIILTSQVIYNKYWNLLTAIQRASNKELTGMQGFRHLLFNDTPVCVDDYIDSESVMYMLNMDHLYWRPYEGGNFDATPFQSTVNQLAMVKIINFQGNMTCDKPQLQCKLSSIT